MKPFLLICFFATLQAQVVPGRYIVELQGEPSAAYAARRGHRAIAADSLFSSRLKEIRSQHATLRQAVQQRGAEVLDSTEVVLNSLIVRIADSQAGRLSSIPGVAKVYPVRLYFPVLDHALPLHHVPDAWNQFDGPANRGAGMKIAIIDTGIDVTHPGFDDSSLVIPTGFPQVNQSTDRAYSNNKIIVVRTYGNTANTTVSGQDKVGHGTGVAMSAAGVQNTGPFGTIIGVAPKAFLGSYKVFPNTTGGAPTDYIVKALDDAISDGMDVLNLSLGSPVAFRTADDPLVSAVENAFAAGAIVVIAAGNDGPDPNTMSSPGTAPNAITVGSMSSNRIFTGSLTVGGGAPLNATPGNGPKSPTPVSAAIIDLASVDPSGLGCNSLPAASLSGSIVLILRGTCFFETKIDNVAEAGAVAALIYAAAESPDAIAMGVGAATLPAAMIKNADGVALKQQLQGGGISGTLNLSPMSFDITAQKVSSFSALGPNIDGSVKPDLVAVGDPISSATAFHNDGSTNDGYVVESGTSLSAPLVAGAAALLKGARPGLSVMQYRSLLINSASLFDTPAAVQQSGAGYLNVQAALQSTLTASPTSLSFGTSSGTVHQSLRLSLSNVGTSDDTFFISVQPLHGSVAPLLSDTVIAIPAGQSQSVTVEFSAESVNRGTYDGLVQVQGSQGPGITKIPYWFGVPSDTPAHVTILDSPASGTAFTQAVVIFRVTDAIGTTTSQKPTAAITSGNGRVLEVVSIDSTVPGAYEAVVRLGSSGSTNVIHIGSGDVAKDVTILAK